MIDMLPKVRGRMDYDAPLGEKLWFGVGGRAEFLFRPADSDDLQDFLRDKPPTVPHVTIGAGSNVIIRDGGIKGVVIRLRKEFADIACDGDILTAGAAAADVNVAKVAAQAGLSGVEFFAGIPGSVGGAVKMNAGANGQEVKDILLDCQSVNEQGDLLTLKPDDLDYAYRHSSLSDRWVILSARFRLQKKPAAEIADTMAAVNEHRQIAQPTKGNTGGSTFKNPNGFKAWELIDQAGCRGLHINGAYISEKHCNFMFNDGTARARDLESLGEEVRRRVLETSGVSLEWEIKRLGEIA